LPPKHDAGTATRHYRAFWQRRCRAAAAEVVLKPSGGNCAVLPLIIIEYRINYRINRKQPQRQGVIPHRCGYFICRFVWFICRARCPHRAGENHKPFVTNLQTICRGRWDLPNIPHIPPSGNKANVRRRTMCAPMGEICVYCPLCTIKQPVGNGLDRSETEGRMSLGLLQSPPSGRFASIANLK